LTDDMVEDSDGKIDFLKSGCPRIVTIRQLFT